MWSLHTDLAASEISRAIKILLPLILRLILRAGRILTNLMKFVKVLFVLAIIAVLALVGFSYWLYSSLTSAHAHDKANQFIVIEKGTAPSAIVDKLAAEGILDSPFATKAYLRTIGEPAKLQAGEYQFSSPITPLQVLKELESGETQTIKLTIPEGFTRFDIAKRLVEKFGNRPASVDGAR